MFIREAIKYARLRRIIKKIDESENLVGNLSQLYGSQFKEDWVGRWYTVLNPLVRKMETVDGVPFEYTTDGPTNRAYVEKWCMDHMFAASQFIKNKELLDVLTYRIERLDDNENYLFVLEPVLFSDFKRSGKRFLIVLASMIVLASIILVAVSLFSTGVTSL